MSHRSVSKRRRAAASKSRPTPQILFNRSPVNDQASRSGEHSTAPAPRQGAMFSGRADTRRGGALDELEGRRQPLPPLPAAPLWSSDEPGASGHRAGTLTPVRPVAQPQIEETTEPVWDDEPFEPATHNSAFQADWDDDYTPARGFADEDEAAAAYRPRPLSRGPRWLRRRSAFSLRERDWRSLAWLRRVRIAPVAGLIAVLGVLLTTFALVVASRAASSAGGRLLGTSLSGKSSTQVVVVRAPQSAAPTTTPTSPYQVGVWASSYSPGTSGAIQIYVRVSQNPTPIVNVSVSLVLQVGGSSASFGPAKTDGDGVAVFNAYYSGASPGQPIYAIATATIGTQTITGETTIVAAGGGAGAQPASQATGRR